MGRHGRRSSWLPEDLAGGRRGTGLVRRGPRRPWPTAVTAVSALVVLGVVAGSIVIGTAAPALALCDGSGGSCVDPSTGGATGVAVVPLSHRAVGDVSVANTSATGSAAVGVLGFVTQHDGTGTEVVRPSDIRSAAVDVQRGQRRTVRLGDVPADARAVVLQLTSADHEGSGEATDAPCTSSSCTTTVHVAFSLRYDPVTQAQLVAALRRYSLATSTTMPADDSVTALAAQVATAPYVPAHLAAAISPVAGGLRVAWQLDPGSEHVTAVRVARSGLAADGSRTAKDDRDPSNGSIVLDGLVAGTDYTVTVAPVIDGSTGAAITMGASPLPGSGQPAASTQPTVAPTPTATPSTTPTAAPTPAPTSASSPAPSTSSPAPTASSTPHASASPAPSATGTPSSPPPTSPPSGGAGGIPAAPAGWKPVFQQDFAKPASTGSFESVYPGYSAYDGGTDTSHTTSRPAAQTGLWNNRSTSSVHDGLFDCRVHTEGQRPQVCALTPTPDGSYWSGQMYGRYSVRFRSDRTAGYKIAWLLWPSSNQWNQGEIDFPEGSLDGTITGSAHDVNGNPSRNAYWTDTHASMDRWQTATIEWKPGRITFMLDNQSWTTTDSSALPRNPMRWALQAETEIRSQAPDPAAQGHLLIDWLAGYSWQG